MQYFYDNYVKDGTADYYLDTDEDIVGEIQNYTYLGHLVNLPADEEDMDDSEIVEVPEVQELLKVIQIQ